MSNENTVRRMYAAYLSGDIATILDQLADDVAWEHWPDNSAQNAGVPWMEARTGVEAVQEFFTSSEGMDVQRMEVGAVMSGGSKVAVEVSFEADNPPFSDTECHVWTFDEHGKVTAMRHYLDTAKHIAAGGVTTQPKGASA